MEFRTRAIHVGSERDPQTGAVVAIRRDITNGQLCAMVAIDDSIKNAAVPVPLAHLQEKGLRHVV